MANLRRTPPTGGAFDDAGDATRRTRLANERTYLAWWRTGLTSFAVSLGVGKLVPELSDGPSWPYTALGVSFALLGSFCLVYALRRQRAVERAVDEGYYVAPDGRVLAALSIVGAVVGILLTVVLIVQE